MSRQDPWLNPKWELCAHCGEVALGTAYIGTDRVCHPDLLEYPDCYRLVTVYHEVLGSRGGKTFCDADYCTGHDSGVPTEER